MVLYPNKLPESERVCSGICSGVANCTNIFADKVAGMPNVVLKMQGEDLSQAGWILMSVPR